MFISVLLPEPLAPTSATSSPRSIVSDTPCSTGISSVAALVALADVFQPDEFHTRFARIAPTTRRL